MLDSLLALGALVLVLSLILVLQHFKVTLWLAILSGAPIIALMTGLSPVKWPGIIFSSLTHNDFTLLALLVFLILLLSGVQEASGQSRKMVRGIGQYLKSPRLRLVLFPALVGLLPMPGGALFSCPMVRDTAEGMDISDKKKALINYWFRHIWEMAWPLYPGYVLICALLGVPLAKFWLYTFPLVISSFAAGWFFLMRDLSPAVVAQLNASLDDEKKEEKEPLGAVLLHTLPIAVVLIGALVSGFLFDRFLPHVPSTLAFCVPMALAAGIALYQGRGERAKPLRDIIITPAMRRIFLILAAIFVFKDTVAASGLIETMSRLGDSRIMLLVTFILLPFVCGLLTGLMVGFVGLAFPLLIGIALHSPLHEYTLPLVVLALIAGNCGQLLSPIHVCLVVTAEFFSNTVPTLMRALVWPVLGLATLGSVWVMALWLFNIRI